MEIYLESSSSVTVSIFFALEAAFEVALALLVVFVLVLAVLIVS
jgi:hypothetical protein